MKLSFDDEEYVYLGLMNLATYTERTNAYIDHEEFAEMCKAFLAHEGYDIVKHTPMIASCPFCKGECQTAHYTTNKWFVGCLECNYRSGMYDTPEEAIENHNLFAEEKQ